MSTIRVDNITDAVGTGSPDFPNGLTASGDFSIGTITSSAADTATSASHYYVETGSDGAIRPKTLANVRTEIVTNAAVDAAGAVMNTGDESIAGIKTFSSALISSTGALGTASGDTVSYLNFTGTNSNVNYLDFIQIRDSAGASWTTAGTRIQQKIDSTFMAWMQFNGTNVNSGISWGAGTGASATSVPEDMRLDSSGILRVLTNVASTNSTSGTVVITGGLGVSGAINAGGDVTAFAASDIRLKTDIENIPDALAKVNQLNGITYRWNDLAHQVEHKDTSVREVGVIAQQVNTVLPEVINIRDNGYMAVRYEKIVPLLIEAIKQLTEQNQRLAQRLSDLEKK